MIVKFGLRDIFRQADVRDEGLSPLERIGALYYKSMQLDQPMLQRELRDMLTSASSNDPEQQMLTLHAAVMLAQSGQFDGVDYILSLLHNMSNRDTYMLAETALRNCNQFPFAALVAQAIEIESIVGEYQTLSSVMRRSDDELVEIVQGDDQRLRSQRASQQKEAQQAQQEQQLITQIRALDTLPRRAGRNLAVGTIIGCPVRTEERYRYSGFVAIERDNHNPLVVPYDQGDILNRNDSRAFQDIDQLLRRPGRRAVLVHATTKPYEVQQMYILPFAAHTGHKLQTLMGTLARDAEGLRVGVAFEVLLPRGYRVITRDGAYHWETFRTEYKQVGSCVFYHELNSQSLSNDLSVRTEDVSEIARDFQQTCTLDRAVRVKQQQVNHTLVSQQGRLVKFRGELPDHPIYYIDEIARDDDTVMYRPFGIPELQWTDRDVLDVLEGFRRSTQLDQAVWVKSSRKRHTLVSRQGSIADLYGEVSPQQIYYLDRGSNKEGKQTDYPFALPDVVWIPIERARILAHFFQYHPEAYGVVLDRFLHDNTALARVVHLQSGQVLRVPCNEEVAPGTLAYCEPSETNILSGYRIEGSCLFCFGTTQRICTACDGKGHSVCPDCGGSQRVQCFDCNNGNISCGTCGGTGTCTKCTNGYWRNGQPCPICQATGRCKSCKPPGSGHWNCGKCHGRATLRCETCRFGIVKCSLCDGLGVSRCNCGGSTQGVIVAL